MTRSTERLTTPDWAALQASIDGEVVLPGTPRYEEVHRPAIARFQNVRPRAVVRCVGPADAAETLAVARRAGLATAVRSGGHCFAGRSVTNGVVIDVTPMCAVSFDGGRAVVGAGTRLGDLYDALAARGLTIPAGCGPTVGIAGLTLGGGLGILGRAYGLTCDSLRAARVVLPDGRVEECDGDHATDLFWALRGGGGLGVVTDLTFDTLPAPASTGFHLTWPHSAAAAVLDAWQSWAPDAPDETAASLLVSTAADVDRPPVVSVFGATVGADTAPLDALVARVGIDPVDARSRPGPHRETKRYLSTLEPHGPGDAGLDPEQRHAYIKSEYFAHSLPADAVAVLIGQLTADRVPGEARELDFSPWGGAYNRVPPDATAFPHRSARFLLKQSAVVAPDATAAAREAARRWLARSYELAHPWGTGGAYANFPDPDLPDPDRAYYGANRDRLRRIRGF
jgi:FAD binding domain/Berberine and berberine like